MSFQVLRITIEERTMNEMGRLKIRLADTERDAYLEKRRELGGEEGQLCDEREWYARQ